MTGTCSRCKDRGEVRKVKSFQLCPGCDDYAMEHQLIPRTKEYTDRQMELKDKGKTKE